MEKLINMGAATLLEIGLRAILAARSSADIQTIHQVLQALEGDLQHRQREINNAADTEVSTVLDQ